MNERQAYFSAVGRAMDCPKQLKSSLLEGLYADANEIEGGFDVLQHQFGTPESVAEELMLCADVDTVRRYRLRRKLWHRCIIAVLLFACVGIMFGYLHERYVRESTWTIELDTVVYEEEAPEDLFPRLDAKGVE